MSYASRRLGTVKEIRTKAQAERAAEAIRMEANSGQPGAVPVTMGGLIDRYIADKLPERYSTRSSYLSCLKIHIKARWGEHTLERIAAAPFEVEKWFEQLAMAPKTKGHLKSPDAPLVRMRHEVGFVPAGQKPNGSCRDQGRDEAAKAAARPHVR
jgi:hypothetical protein